MERICGVPADEAVGLPYTTSGWPASTRTAADWRLGPHSRLELDRVFEKFHRVEDPMTMTTGGTGLGLYIARELTRAMGGEIEATSAPPGLDLHRPPAPGPAARRRRGGAGRS
jgi:hypothetical protein